MIRLTLNAQSDPEIHLFNKSTILLGSDSSLVDLLLSEADIQPIHIKITEQNGFPVLINYANDPFVSVNGHAFGKKLLNSGDIITIHHMTILFETLNSSIPEENSLKKDVLASLLDNKMDKQEEATLPSFPSSPFSENMNYPSFTLPFEKEVEIFQAEELQKSSIDVYLKELEAKELPKPPAAPQQKKQAEKGERKKGPKSLKDDYLRDLEDDNHNHDTGPFGNLNEPSYLYQAWKWILLFIFSLLTIFGLIGTVLYFNVSDKREAQETKIMQGVADIAMALVHAHINQLKPHNQNWSDVDFLKTNLQAILPEIPSYASQIDAQGQFNCCPYSLRIYTNSELSHYLLIAQPAPSLLYWLIPKSIIVVDSQLMELRTLKDVRSLNRLLANADPLEGVNGKEITLLIKQGELIRLSDLAQESGHFDFDPPKNLNLVRPGAENLIYNAPRYYRLGQNLMQIALNLSNNAGSSHEVALLKQEVENIGWLQHFILYSDQGKKTANLARQSVGMYAPSEKVLFGYLLFNAQGKIHQVHLLKEQEKKDIAANSSKEKDREIIAFQSPSETKPKEDFIQKNSEHPTIDQNHPIYIQLQSLVSSRENELKPLISGLTDLVNQDLQFPRPQFQLEFQNLSHSYLMLNEKHKQIIKTSLDMMYQQYENIPIDEFLAFIKDLRLDQLIRQEGQSVSIIDENCHQNIESLLTQIESSKSLVELNNFVRIASTWLNFDYIKDPQELLKYQNLVRNELLKQLEKFLLSQKKHFLIIKEDKGILENILGQERLIKPEERDFFLQEFNDMFSFQSNS